MTQTATHKQTLMSAIWPATAGTRWLRLGILALLGSMAIAISAKTQVPFYPVPMTMHTFAVFTIAAAFGGRLATATMALYLFEGALGLPVFSGSPERGLGLAYLMGPTGGYLIGYLVAAAMIGFIVERDPARRSWVMALAMLAGIAIVFALGLLWLGTLIGWDKPVISLGFTPFILGDLFKIALAVATVGVGWKVIERWRAKV